ncbi:MAG: alpha/beta hydrolase [Rhodospirillaceae bacterium]|jgi:acetyl esterase/lipase|nr:alpha/beta hydrolase [Rhodospirillaceae bacterium]MBT3883651.1 alpha/beta hydrolase [Rhodospirillaceae bacterium]MBT4117675.1 alpha/beta hydrolase [Rhodospirillaceae bacterium]MBT4674587.1 alpha/beta hydrolase [Rhodospirillaceae bacterium]MBT4719238.1 alpha/beta hydrolase [Rhodospirillaceae bacterium]
MTTDTLNFTNQDFTYINHGERAMNLRLVRPAGDATVPAIIDLHGGAWNNSGPESCQERGEVLAASGIAAAALQFRHGPDRYPSTLEDINYAVRWMKANASELGIDAARIGIAGQSSGGHLAMLAAMRPSDARYGALELEGGTSIDASIACVGMMWPVINPLSRYRYAKGLNASAEPPKWSAHIPGAHDTYWVTEDAMREGNPMLALERGEAVETPPALWIQGRPDAVHNYVDEDSGQTLTEPERFAANYRKAGGDIDVLYIDQETRSSTPVFQALADFFVKNMG